jgi:Fe-Mn family superoxide dismutase
MLRPALPRIGRSLRSCRRSLHTEFHNVPLLKHSFQLDGVPDLLSVAAVDIAWTQYQGLMVEKLNALTAGMLKGSTLLFSFV